MIWYLLGFIVSFVFFYDIFYPGQIKYFIVSLGWQSDPAIIKVVYDGEEIRQFTFDTFKKNIDSITTYDFILQENPLLHNKKYDNYVVRYENKEDVLYAEYNSLKCITLTDIEIKINNKDKHTIDFQRNQYMIDGNVLLDRYFLKWYLNTQKNIALDDEDHYIVTFLDQNRNTITLKDYCYIYIKKKGYVIVNNIYIPQMI